MGHKIQYNASTQKIIFDAGTQKIITSVDCTSCWTDGTIRLTFSGVTLCSGKSWPGSVDLNTSWDLTFYNDTGTGCVYRYLDSNWYIAIWVIKANCTIYDLFAWDATYVDDRRYFEKQCATGLTYYWSEGTMPNALNTTTDPDCGCVHSQTYSGDGSVIWTLL